MSDTTMSPPVSNPNDHDEQSDIDIQFLGIGTTNPWESEQKIVFLNDKPFLVPTANSTAMSPVDEQKDIDQCLKIINESSGIALSLMAQDKPDLARSYLKAARYGLDQVCMKNSPRYWQTASFLDKLDYSCCKQQTCKDSSTTHEVTTD